MTIPLHTYDPNWESRWEEANLKLTYEKSRQVANRSQASEDELRKQIDDAFHAQFPTTGDYAAWCEKMIQQTAAAQGLDDFRFPPIPPESSVENTQKLCGLLRNRINRLKDIENKQRPLSYPQKGEAFSLELNEGATRTLETISLRHGVPICPGSEFIGRNDMIASSSYVIETRPRGAHICFLQINEDGPSPMSSIEALATHVYCSRLGMTALAAGGVFYRPTAVNIYLYLPPTSYEERFVRVGLQWDEGARRFCEPTWNNLPDVPYVIRKIAASEGVAHNPDKPRRSDPKPGNSERPRGQPT